MAVNLTTNSLVDYMKSIPGCGENCKSSSCKQERMYLWMVYRKDMGYAGTKFEWKGWQNTKILNYIRDDLNPPFHTFTFPITLGNYQQLLSGSSSSSNQQSTTVTVPPITTTTTTTYKTTDIFDDLSKWIAGAESAGATNPIEKAWDDGNIAMVDDKIQDYHLGYWQCSGHNINTFTKYIKYYISHPPNSPDQPYADYRDLWDKWYSELFITAYAEMKVDKFTWQAQNFIAPGLWDMHHQRFFQALFICDAIKAYTDITAEQVILNNIMGAGCAMGWFKRVPWDKQNMYKNIYADKPHLPKLYAFDYLKDSNIPGLPKSAVSQDDFEKVFTTFMKGADIIASCKEAAIKAYNASPHLQDKLDIDAINRMFDKKSLYQIYSFYDPNYLPPIIEAPLVALPPTNILTINITTNPQSLPGAGSSIQTASNIVDQNVQDAYREISEDPKFYKLGVGAEQTGLTYVGDILLSLPPVALRFSDNNQSTAIPSMRTDGDPIFTTNNSIPRVDMTVFFNGEIAINEQLRPLVSMFQRLPFTTIQNTTIWKAWIGRRDPMDENIQQAMNHFAPIPCYLENISISTIPGFPNSVQAHISIVRMNRSPYGQSARMWRNWEDATLHAKRRTLRTSRDNTLYATERDENTKRDKLYIMDTSMKSHTLEVPDTAADGNKILDPILTTQYPQESMPYKYQYRSILFDDGMPLGSNLYGKDIWGRDKEPLTHWPPYNKYDNEQLYLTYKSAKQFRTPTKVFKTRLRELTENYTKIEQLAHMIKNKTTPELLEIYKPLRELNFTDLISHMIKSLSAVKVGEEFATNLNKAFGTIVNEIILDTQALQGAGGGTLGNPFEEIEVEVCEGDQSIATKSSCEDAGHSWETITTWGYINPIMNVNTGVHDILKVPGASSSSDWKYVNEKGEIVNTFKDFLESISILTGDTGFCIDHPELLSGTACLDAGEKWKDKPETDEERQALVDRTKAFMEPFYLYITEDPMGYLGLDDVGSAWNYDTVGIQFSWMDDLDHLAVYDEMSQYLIDENAHKPRETNRLINPYLYQFQSVIQSVTYSFANSVIPFYTASHNIPTYQHMGIPSPTANIILRTRDERLLKIITDMKESIQEIGSQMLAGNSKLAGLGTVDVSGAIFAASNDRHKNRNKLLSNTGVLSGHLLNSLGFGQANVQNLSTRSIEGSPGWWEISIDLISNSQNIRILEHLNTVSNVDIPDDIHLLMEEVFPSHKIDFKPIMDMLEETQEWKDKVKIGEDIELLKIKIGQINDALNAYNVYVNADYDARMFTPVPQFEGVRIYTAKNRADKAMKALKERDRSVNKLHKDAGKILALAPHEFHTTAMGTDPSGNFLSWTLYINASTFYEWEGVKITKEEKYREILGPMMNAMLLWLQRLQTWENEQKLSDPDWDASYPDTFSISQTMKVYYEDYLNNVIYTISGLAWKDATIFLDHRQHAIMPGYSRTAEQVTQTIIRDAEVVLQTVILANQLRTVFYMLMRRSDFRSFLDTQVVPRNRAISELLERLEQQLQAWSGAFALSVDVGDTTYNVNITGTKEEAQTAVSQAIAEIKNSNLYIDPSTIPAIETYSLFLRELNENIKENHPDLRLPRDRVEETGHVAIGPGFPFVDDDMGLELIEMSKVADKIKMVTFAQLAAITSGEMTKYYEDIADYLGEWRDDGRGGQYFEENDKSVSLTQLLSGSFTQPDTLDFNLPMSMSVAGFKEHKFPGVIIPEDSDDRQTLSIPHMLNSFKLLANKEKEIQDALASGAKELMGTTSVAPTKRAIMDLMASTAMLDYLINLMMVSTFLKELANKGFQVNVGQQYGADLSALANKVMEQLVTMNVDGTSMADLLADTIQMPYTSHPTNPLTKAGKDKDLAIAMIEDLLQKRRTAASIATLSATGNYKGFLDYFGIGDLNSVKKSYELKSKFTEYIAQKNSASMDRAFPAFKIFFIEEDGYAWQAFDDFYTYDAASSITIVESKHSASSTCLLKLSNVTNVLTNDIGIGMMNEMMSVTPGALLRLKVGSPVMVLVGYGADYRQLRMKFKGAVTEMKTGPVLELTCQSWGAGLLNAVGASGGIEYNALSGATSLGAAVIDILSQTPGMSGLGRWEIRDSSLNDPSKVTETHLRNAWHARALNSIAGWAGDFIKLNTNIRDVVGTLTSGSGVPTTKKDLKEAWRTNNVIVKAMGNSLYDNIIINNTDPSGYGFYNYFSRALSKWGNVYSEKTFKWFVVRQTAWEALHECALFLGDYILTTRPFNEGNDIFNQPPRETLYFGPRDGTYRCKTFVPKVNQEAEMNKLREMMQSIVIPPKGSTAYNALSSTELQILNDQQEDVNQKLLSFGKIMMSKVLDYHITVHSPGGGTYPGFDPIRLQNNFGSYRRRWKEWQGGKCNSSTGGIYSQIYQTDIYHPNDLLANFRHSMLLNSFKNVEALIKSCEIVSTCYKAWSGSEKMGRIMDDTKSSEDIHNCVDHVSGAFITQLINWTDEEGPPINVIKELLLNDFEHLYDAPGTQYKEFPYTGDERLLIEYIKQGKIKRDVNQSLKDLSFEYNGTKIEELWTYGAVQKDTAFEKRHLKNWGGATGAKYSVFPWLFAQPSSLGLHMTGSGTMFQCGTDIKENYEGDCFFWSKWRRYLIDIDAAIIKDTKYLIENWAAIQQSKMTDYQANKKNRRFPEKTYKSRKTEDGQVLGVDMSFGYFSALAGGVGGGGENFHPVIFDLQDALLRNGGLLNAFAFRSVVDHHMVNSYEDIIDNSIVATADQMYNHVEVLFPESPDSTASVTNTKYRTSAMISYDQDPDYLRTYQSYQKNIDYSTWYDMTTADSVITSMQTGGVEGKNIIRATGLDQKVVAQSILMNQIRPMYQGTLTLIGNPHIKPWDIVHIHDDSIGMYGPVEIEQVVTHMSVNEGYTTTIVPNLLVYYKNASRALDGLIMNIHSSINTLNYWMSVMKWGGLATVGLMATQTYGQFGTTAFRTFPLFGRMLGLKQLNKKAVGWTAAQAAFKNATAESLLANKKLAKKYLTKSEFKTLETIAKSQTAQSTKVAIASKHATRRLGDLSMTSMTKNPKLIALFGELEVLMTNSSNSIKNRALIKRTRRQIASVLGKGDINAGLTKLSAYTRRYDVALKQLTKTHAILAEIAPTSTRVKQLATQITKLTESVAELNRLRAIRMAGQSGPGRPYKNLGASIAKATAKVNTIAVKVHTTVISSSKHVQLIVNRRIKTDTNKIVAAGGKKLLSRMNGGKFLAKAIPVLGWAWLAYDLFMMGKEIFHSYASGKIFLAGLLSGENQLVWLPLEYQGKEYVAGLEGIIGTPRSASTILYGELSGDLTTSNRGFLEMQMIARFDYDSNQ